MSNHTLEDAILNFVAQSGYRPMKPRAIAQRLHLSKDQTDDLKRSVKRLVRSGKLAYGANHLVRAGGAAGGTGVSPVLRESTGKMPAPPGAAMSQSSHSGRLPSHAKRLRIRPPPGPFARRRRAEFTRDKKTGGEEAGHCRRPCGAAGVQDIYIPRKYTGDAASGDLVLVQLQRGGARAALRTEQPAAEGPSPAGPAGKDRRSGRSANAAVRGPLPRIRGVGIRPGRWDALRTADLRRRSGCEGGAGGRQGGLRDGPLPLARTRRRRRDRRGARPAGQAGGRYALDPPRVQLARTFRGGRSRRGPAGGGEVRRVDFVRPARPDRL